MKRGRGLEEGFDGEALNSVRCDVDVMKHRTPSACMTKFLKENAVRCLGHDAVHVDWVRSISQCRGMRAGCQGWKKDGCGRTMC
jgi:hypothetical protein